MERTLAGNLHWLKRIGAVAAAAIVKQKYVCKWRIIKFAIKLHASVSYEIIYKQRHL